MSFFNPARLPSAVACGVQRHGCGVGKLQNGSAVLLAVAAALVASVVASGCDSADDPNKVVCQVPHDCLDGYSCVAGRCQADAAGSDLSGAADLAGAQGRDSGADADNDLSPALHGKWSSLSDMPTARGELALVALPDGRLFALGGNANGSVVATVEVYTPSTDSWTAVSSMHTARAGFGAALGSDGHLYVMGGQFASVVDDGASRLAESYDVASDTWSALPSLSERRSDCAAVAAKDSKLYVVGGYDYTITGPVGTWEAWTPGGASWVESTFHMTTPRSAYALALAADGRVFAFGGADQTEAAIALVEWFQPGSSGWSTTASMPSPRLELAASAGADGKLYAIGGSAYDIGGQPELATVEAYSPSAHSWETVAPMPTARFGLAAALGADGKSTHSAARRRRATSRPSKPSPHDPAREPAMKRDDNGIDRLLGRGQLSRPEKERRLEALLDGARKPRRSFRLALAWAVPVAAALALVPLVYSPRADRFRAKGGGPGPGVEASCAGGCTPGATLIYRVDGLGEPAYLSAYGVAASGERIWHFPSESGELPRLVPGSEHGGPVMVPRGIRLGKQLDPQKLTWLLLKRRLSREQILLLPSASEDLIARGVLVVPVRP